MHWWLLELRKLARLTWELAGTTAARAVGLADWEVSLADLGQAAKAVGLADWEVGLAGSGQAVISSVDLKVNSADSELEGSPHLLLIGA
jgi:hypothetical protein